MTEESLFAEAIEFADPLARAAFLERACEGDAELRRAVEALLVAHHESNPLDRPPVVDGNLTQGYAPSSEKLGTVIAGRYKLLEEIGLGGMGAVWVAEQIEPVKRKVALKLIKPGMDSRAVLARFEAERQALALMDHPNIAKVHDGGLDLISEPRTSVSGPAQPLTDVRGSGRPFFVMEYVKGIPITEYCDALRLRIEERLQLFIQVCHAVQHAHQKGVIHRDLKPSNILVAPYDGKPVPKVIDFGLAKAMHQPLTDKTLHTAHETVLGTPLYMSPEQAQLNNLDVDTRSDIYSLGVLLYELLTGTTPLDRQRFKEAAWDEIRRIIREEEPPRPSARLSSTATLPSLAASRQTEPLKLTNLLRGELDWIVMKALEKERGRRYESANDFAADIGRYLTGDPVVAAPPSAGYRLRKFVQRHRGPVTVAGVIAVTLIVAIIGTSWGWREALWQRDDAIEARREEASQRSLAVEAIAGKRDAALARADAEERARKLAEKVAEADRQKLVAEQGKIEDAKRHVRLIEAHLALERGTNRCERGEIGPGLLWLVRGLEVVPDDAHDLKQSLQTLLGGWSAQLHSVKSVRPVPLHLARLDQHQAFFSSDGKTVLRVDGGRAGQLWDIAMDKPIGPAVEFQNMTTAAMSSDGKTLLTGNGNNVQLWDVATRKPNGPPLRLHDFYMNATRSTFSPDGKKFLIGIGNQTDGVQLWDLVARKRIATLALHGDVAFSPDGRIALTLGHTEVRLWDAETGKSLGKPLVHESVRNAGILLAGIFSPDSSTLATASENGTVRLWEVGTGKSIGQPLKHGQGPPLLAFSHDGTLILTGSSYGRDVLLWDVVSGKPVGAPLGHPGPVHRVGFGRDGKTIETVSSDGVRLWNLNVSKPLHEFRGQELSPFVVAFNPDGKTFLTSTFKGHSAPGTFHIWDASTGKLVGKPIEKAFAAAYSPDGKIIVTGHDKGLLKKWDAATGKLLADSLQHPATNGLLVYDVTYSPDGKTILAAANESGPIGPQDRHSALQLWNAATGEPLGQPLRLNYVVQRFHFSPDSKFFVTGGNMGGGWATQLWDAARRIPLGEPVAQGPGGAVFTPDSKKLLLSVLDSGKIKGLLLDTATGKPTGNPLDFKENFGVGAIRPNGQLIATGPGGVRVLDPEKGAPIGEILRQEGPVGVHLSPDGKMLLTISGYSAGFWDLETGKLVGPLVPLGESQGSFYSYGAAFSPDGKTLVVGGHQGARLWPVPTPLQADAKEVRLWLEVNTGQELDAGGALLDLDAKTWRERYDRLQKLGGPPLP